MAKNRTILEVLLTAKDEISKTTRRVGSSFEKLQGRITALSTGFLAVRQVAQDVAGVFDSVVGSAVRLSRQLVSMRDRLGINIEAQQELKFVAEQNNIAFEQLTMGLQRAGRRIAEAAQGMGEAKSAIEELRLDAVALAQAEPDKQLEAIADALAGVKSQSDRVRLAFKFFDSEGVSILQTFGEDGAKDIQRLREEFVELGGVMDEELVEKMDEIGRAMDRLGVRAIALRNDLLTALDAFFEWRSARAGEFEAPVSEGETLPGVIMDIVDAYNAETAAVLKTSDAWTEYNRIRSRAFKLEEEIQGKGLRPFTDPSTFPGSGQSPTDLAAARAFSAGMPGAKGERAFDKQGIIDASNEALKMRDILRDITGIYVDELTPAQIRLSEEMATTNEMAENLGATMVTTAMRFADSFARGFADVIVNQKKFNKMAEALMKQFAVNMITEINRIIARYLVAAALKLFISGGNPAAAVSSVTSTFGSSQTAGLVDPARANASTALNLDPGLRGGNANLTVRAVISSVFPAGRAEGLAVTEAIRGGLQEIGAF